MIQKYKIDQLLEGLFWSSGTKYGKAKCREKIFV